MLYIIAPNTSAAVVFAADKGKWILAETPEYDPFATSIPEFGIVVQGTLEEPEKLGAALTALSEAWTTLCCAAYAKREPDYTPGEVIHAPTLTIQLPAGYVIDQPSSLNNTVFGHSLQVDDSLPPCSDAEARYAINSALAAYAPVAAPYQQYTLFKAIGPKPLIGEAEPPVDPVDTPPLEPLSSPFPPPPTNDIPVIHAGKYSYDPDSNIWMTGDSKLADHLLASESQEQRRFRGKRVAQFVNSLEFLAAQHGPTRTPYKLPGDYEPCGKLQLCMESGGVMWEYTSKGWEEIGSMMFPCTNIMPGYTLGCKLTYNNDVVVMTGNDWLALVAHTMNTFNTGPELPAVEEEPQVVSETSDAQVCFSLLGHKGYMQYDFTSGWWAYFGEPMEVGLDAEASLGAKDIVASVHNWSPVSARVLATMLASLGDAWTTYAQRVYMHRDAICAKTAYGDYNTVLACLPDTTFGKWPSVLTRTEMPTVPVAFVHEGVGSYTHINGGWTRGVPSSHTEECPVQLFGMHCMYDSNLPTPESPDEVATLIVETLDAFRTTDTEETRFAYALAKIL